MSDWQPLAPGTQLRAILDVAALTLYSDVAYYTSLRPGLAVLFIPGEFIEQIYPEFPASWLDLYRSKWDFAKEKTQNVMKVEGLSQPYAVHRRYLQASSYGVGDLLTWIKWLVERANHLLLLSTDPTGFLQNGIVDFVTCFEHGLSVDRLLRKSISAQVSAEVSVRKYTTFEVADIIDELCHHWLKAPETETFKELFNPERGLVKLRGALAGAPSKIRDLVLDGAESVYDDLKKTILDSVFMGSKKTSSGGVLVLDKKPHY